MEHIKLPFIVVGYMAKACLALWLGAQFALSWLLIFAAVIGVFSLIVYATGSVIPAILTYAPIVLGAYLLWKRDN